jgi:hypothetical protein
MRCFLANSHIPEANPFARKTHPAGIYRLFPILETLRTYRREWVLSDLVAGLVLTAMLVPVGMGYAAASGLPAIYGLYASIVPLIAYAIFWAKPYSCSGAGFCAGRNHCRNYFTAGRRRSG